MADGMDKAYFLRQQVEDLEWVYDAVWSAATTFTGHKDLELGVLDLADGGFVLLTQRPGEWQAWRVTPDGDLRTISALGLRRLVEDA